MKTIQDNFVINDCCGHTLIRLRVDVMLLYGIGFVDMYNDVYNVWTIEIHCMRLRIKGHDLKVALNTDFKHRLKFATVPICQW